RDVNTEFLDYSNYKMAVVSFPGLEAGDVVEVKWTVRDKKPSSFLHFGRRTAFGRLSEPDALDREADAPRNHFPVVRQVVQLRLPRTREDAPLRFAATGGALGHTVLEEESSHLHTWEAENYQPPAAGPEGDERRLTLYYSTYSSWDDIEFALFLR